MSSHIIQFSFYFLSVFLLFKNVSARGTAVCSKQHYNPNKQVCCDGVLHDRIQKGAVMECCTRSVGAELYDRYKQLCCGEQLLDLDSLGLYNGQKPLCCNKELILPGSRYDSCCGDGTYGQPYKFATHSCCIKEETKQTNILGKLGDRERCCGLNPYNKDTHDCFPDDEIKPLRYYALCGDTEYNTATHICCAKTGKLMAIPEETHSDIHVKPEWRCVNDSLVDLNKYSVTPDGQIIPKGHLICGNDHFPSEPTANSKYLCCQDKLHRVRRDVNASCCGNDVINDDDGSVICCGGKIVSSSFGCCGDETYHKGHDTMCCGIDLFNINTQVCCRLSSSISMPITKLGHDHTSCCRLGETNQIATYNMYDKICFHGNLYEKDTWPFKQSSVHITNKPGKIQREKPAPGCPFCSTKFDASQCEKKNVYHIFVYGMRKLDFSIRLKAVMLSPEKVRGTTVIGEKIKVTTRNQCSCFREKTAFYVFTNRKLKVNTGKLRFTSNDMFLRADDEESLQKCLRYHIQYLNIYYG